MLAKMDCSGLTDCGRVRRNNEDQFLVATLNKSMQVHETSLRLEDHTRLFGPAQGRLLLVADGMGGHAAGERASALAVDTLAQYVLSALPWFFRLREGDEPQLLTGLRDALAACQRRLNAEARRVPAERGMGTTMTLAFLAWPRAYVVHAGDSRCYLWRAGRLWRVTSDHTIARKMADRGLLEDPEDPRFSSQLWNVVGGGTEELSPDVHRGDLAAGDVLLLCTDGLTRHVPDDQIAAVLGSGVPAKEACRVLIDAANAAGGSDNVTAVVARFPPA